MIVRFCSVFCDCTIVEWLIGNDVCGTAAIFLGDYRVLSHAGAGWHERQTMYIRAVPQNVLGNRCNDAISSCGVISHMWSGVGRREKIG